MSGLFVFSSMFGLIATFEWAIVGALHGAIYIAYAAPLSLARLPKSARRPFLFVPATISGAAFLGGASSWFDIDPKSSTNVFMAISAVLTLATSAHVFLATRKAGLAVAPIGGLVIVAAIWLVVKDEIDLMVFGIAGWHAATCALTVLWSRRTPRLAFDAQA